MSPVSKEAREISAMTRIQIGTACTVMATAVTLVWMVAGMKADASQSRSDIAEIKTAIVKVTDKLLENERRITANETKVNALERGR